MNQSADNSNPAQSGLESRWPHRVGAILALVVFPLICLGGLVTTFDAGMAVPDWPGTYGYNMFLYPIETWVSGPFDLFVEHGHRLLGSLSGMIAILLVFVTFRCESRGWVKAMSIAILLLVIVQGLLGGIRVLNDDRSIAKIHGCVGPAFFGLVTAFCVVTSKWWIGRRTEKASFNAPGLKNLATLMLVVSFGQLVVGAFLRHVGIETHHSIYRMLIFLHVGTAVVLVLGTFTQWITTRLRRFRGTGIRFSINVLMLLILVQFGLGLITYVVKFGWPGWLADQDFAAGFIVGEKTFLQMNLITSHVAVGSLILAFWVVQALRCHRAFAKASMHKDSPDNETHDSSRSSRESEKSPNYGSNIPNSVAPLIEQPVTSS